ncbi:uncharacterized protein [Diadema antillarum]|uniref:uncharacterized protein n=1 Tax=Diadema antillarum TaxID=105358 RepID=UPI003A8B5352
MLTGNRTAEVIKDYSYSSASNQLIIFFTSNFQSSKTGFQFHVQALPSQDSAVDTATVDRVTYIESTVSPYPDLNSTSERRGDILSRLVFIVGLTVTGLLMCIVLSAMAIRCLKKRRRVKLQLNYYDQSHGDDDRISTADESDFSSALPVRIFRHHHHPPSESRTELFSSELSSAWSSPNISTYPYSDWSAVTDNTTNSEQTAVPMQASCGNLFAIHRPQISRAPPTSGRSHQFLITLPLEIQRSQLFHAMSCRSVLDNETDNAEGQSTADRTNRSSFSDVSTEMGSRDVITTACQTDPFTHDHAHRSHASTGNAMQGVEEGDERERECEANDNVVENESEQSSMSSRQEGANITTTIPEAPASLTDTDRVCATGSVSASNQPPRGSVQRKVSHIYFKGAGVQRPEPESDPESPREPLSAGVTSPIQSIVQWFEGKKEDSNSQITHTYYKGSQVRHPKRPDAPPNLPHATLFYEDASSLRLS